MKPQIWTYEDPIKQIVHYRGYVNTYQGSTMTKVYSEEVRGNKWKALEDAKQIVKRLRQKK